MGEHFNQVVEMVKLGSGTFRKVENWHLSRVACLIIAENADGKKPQVQTARIYFKEQTSLPELVENQMTSRILIYKTNQGETRVEVLLNGQTFWLSQKRMANLYTVDVSTINYHLGQIFATGELKEEAVIRKFPITAAATQQHLENQNMETIIQLNANAKLSEHFTLGEFTKSSHKEVYNIPSFI